MAAAAAVAAQINQKLGTTSGPPQIPLPQTAQVLMKITEKHTIPEKYVGLLIGKGGEQISRFQEVSGANIQIAPESEGTNVRSISINGTPEQIQCARTLIDEVATKADRAQFDSRMPPRGQSFIEMKIPGHKVGLIIGKGGETIKALQEQCGVKMVMIQDNNTPTDVDKPLHVTGSDDGVARARDMVNELMASKSNFPTGGRQGASNYSSNGGGGAFDNKNPNVRHTTYAVPADRTGLVIGKGGETIKEICRMSSAHVEIQKQPPPNPSIKIFNVSGDQHAIDHAIQLICEKAGISSSTSNAPSESYSGYTGPNSGHYNQNSWNHNVYGGHNNWYGASGAGGQPNTGDSNSASMPASSAPMTTQADYSSAWAEYYRSQGMHEYADAILAQARLGAQSNNLEAGQQPTHVQHQQNPWQQQWQQWQQHWAQQVTSTSLCIYMCV